jgi:hypothetical protein
MNRAIIDAQKKDKTGLHLFIRQDGKRYIWYWAKSREPLPDRYYCTNNEGDGIFVIDLVRNDRKQLIGTCQFSLAGIKDPRGKIRRYYKEEAE